MIKAKAIEATMLVEGFYLEKGVAGKEVYRGITRYYFGEDTSTIRYRPYTSIIWREIDIWRDSQPNKKLKWKSELENPEVNAAILGFYNAYYDDPTISLSSITNDALRGQAFDEAFWRGFDGVRKAFCNAFNVSFTTKPSRDNYITAINRANASSDAYNIFLKTRQKMHSKEVELGRIEEFTKALGVGYIYTPYVGADSNTNPMQFLLNNAGVGKYCGI